MNPALVSWFVQPSAALTELFQEEPNGYFWGWVLLLLLILALVILWWLLGTGIKRRLSRMTDLPKPSPADASSAPRLPAGLPISQATPALPTIEPDAESAAVATGEQSVPEEPPPAMSEAADEMAVETAADNSADDSVMVNEEATDIAETDVAETDVALVERASGEVVAPLEPDNLRKIEGIGPKVAGILIANGVATFAQLAETPVERLMEILVAEGLKFMKPHTWPAQAAFAAKGDWDGLQGLQNQLKGGRRIEE